MKRIIFLCILVIGIISPLHAKIIITNIEKEGIFYQLYDDLTACVLYNPYMKDGHFIHYDIEDDIIISPTIEYNAKSYTVTSIHDEAFFKSKINTVIMPNTINFIGCWAFQESTIKSIIIPPNVRIIDRGAFNYCKDLETGWIQYSNSPIAMHTQWGAEGAYGDNTPIADIIEDPYNYYEPTGMFKGCDIDNLVIEREYDIARRWEENDILEYICPENWERNGYGPFVLCDRIGRVEFTRDLKSRWIAPSYNPVDCVWLGENVNEITKNWPSRNVDKFFSLNPIPPQVLKPAISQETAENANVYVPAQSIEAYKNDSYWGQFNNIRSIEDAVEGVVEDGSCQPFVISGNKITFDADVDRYTLYDINGNIVSSGDGTSPLEVETHGIHILHVNNRAFKILF